MVELLIDKLHDMNFIVTVLTAIATMATVITVAMPFLANDNLARRMKAVALERNKIRAREREKLARGERVVLRSAPKPYMQAIVEKLNLKKHLGQDEARATLMQGATADRGLMWRYCFSA